MSDKPELNPETAVTVGRITAAHGVRGELKVQPLSDFPRRFQRGSTLWLEGVPLEVERGRWQGRNVILKLQGVDTRAQAEALAGKELTVPEAAEIEAEGVYYLHDVIGLSVETAAGEALGKLSEVITTGSNDVYVVRGDRGELLLPALDDVIREVQIAASRMVVEVPEGLEFSSAPRAGGERPRHGRRRKPSSI